MKNRELIKKVCFHMDFMNKYKSFHYKSHGHPVFRFFNLVYIRSRNWSSETNITLDWDQLSYVHKSRYKLQQTSMSVCVLANVNVRQHLNTHSTHGLCKVENHSFQFYDSRSINHYECDFAECFLHHDNSLTQTDTENNI